MSGITSRIERLSSAMGLHSQESDTGDSPVKRHTVRRKPALVESSSEEEIDVETVDSCDSKPGLVAGVKRMLSETPETFHKPGESFFNVHM